MSIEAMKQALEALEYYQCRNIQWEDTDEQAITSLRQAIAEAEKQEPVGVVGMDVSRPHMRSLDGQYFGQKPDTKTVMLFKDLEVGTKLYTKPQQRKPLTDEELRVEFGKLYPNDIGILELAENNKDFAIESIGARHHWTAFKAGARATEAKLKEKNT